MKFTVLREKYKKELEAPEIQEYIKEVTNKTTLSEDKVIKLLLVERTEVDNMLQATHVVNVRIKYGLV